MTSHIDIARNWANQTGKGKNGFNMFYEGKTIYSYGYHFPIAEFFTAPNGENVILFTNRSYSVSTSKHISYVRRALDHNAAIIPVNLTRHEYTAFDAKRDRKELLDEIPSLELKAKRARKYRDMYERQIAINIAMANRLSKLFKLRFKDLPLPTTEKLAA